MSDSFELITARLPSNPSQSLSFFINTPLLKAGFSHAFSTRKGGVSFGAGQLNFSFKHDDPKAVSENRRRFLESLGNKESGLATLRQIHSARLEWVDAVKDEDAYPEGDALASVKKNIYVGIKTADCLPILIGDPSSGVFAAIHAGWKGTSLNVSGTAVKNMKINKGFNPREAVAALGPYACEKCYEVREDVFSLFQGKTGEDALRIRQNGTWGFDSGRANKAQLIEAGLKEENIYILGRCTIHEEDFFFSHRRDGKKGPKEGQGRLLSVIGVS